jgi:hypothetical protein
MGTLLDDSALVRHHDQIGVAHGRETVRDHQGSTPSHQALQGLVDQALADRKFKALFTPRRRPRLPPGAGGPPRTPRRPRRSGL